MSSYHDRHARRPRVPSLNQMDPTQLATFAVSRVPRSPAIAGLVLNHHISGQILAESPPDLINHLTEGLGPDVHEDFRRLSLDVNATIKPATRRLRPLTEIVAQINAAPLPTNVLGSAHSPPPASIDESFSWDFEEENSSGSGGVNSPCSDSTSLQQDSAGDLWDYEDIDTRTTHESLSGFSLESPGPQSDTVESVHPGDVDNMDGADEDSLISERNAALDEVLCVLTDPGLLAVSSAMQRHTADLNATIVGGLSSDTEVVQRISEPDTLLTPSSAYFAIHVNTSFLVRNTRISSHVHVDSSPVHSHHAGRRPTRYEASGTDVAEVLRGGRDWESGDGTGISYVRFKPSSWSGFSSLGHEDCMICTDLYASCYESDAEFTALFLLFCAVVMKCPKQLCRGAGRSTVKISRDEGHAVFHIPFPPSPTDKDLKDEDLDWAPLTLAHELKLVEASKVDIDNKGNTTGKLETAKVKDTYTSPPRRVRGRTASILAPKVSSRSRSRSRARAVSYPPLADKGEATTSPTDTLPADPIPKCSKERVKPIRRPFNVITRSPLSKNEHGHEPIAMIYHCTIPKCGFAASSQEHIREHVRRTSHGWLAPRSKPVRHSDAYYKAVLDETLTF
ncbi:hypothetical protein NM688_g2314 [Phlebia brevispora]|uniref:Uncharacterized protein n=1 Tax=Phlebia brevispora TaxID=194682 RepID=A0ACC1T955_9APHY|nr:hypothetical protein NM688_g2314 [Phlebia brevispora]